MPGGLYALLRLGFGFGGAIPATLGIAAFGLLMAVVYYVTSRKSGVTLREAIFNWQVVAVVGVVAFLVLIA